MTSHMSMRELAETVGYDGKLASFAAFVRRKATLIEAQDPTWKAVWDTRLLVGRGYKFPRKKVQEILAGDTK